MNVSRSIPRARRQAHNNKLLENRDEVERRPPIAVAYRPAWSMLLAAVLLLTSLACAGAPGQPRTVRIYNWVEYLPQEVLDSFRIRDHFKSDPLGW